VTVSGDTTGPAPVPPTGRQIALRAGPWEAVVTEVGAGLRDLRLDGAPVVSGFAEDALPDAAAGQLLAPWPNRVHGGAWSWKRDRHRLPVDDHDNQAALHGLVRWMPWRVVDAAPAACALALRLPAREGYPFTLDLEAAYTLADDGLTVRLGVRNASAAPAPVGVGAHPYLRLAEGRLEDWTLTLPATHWMPSGPGLTALPRHLAVADSPAPGLPTGIVLDGALDDCFTGMGGDAPWVARLTGPGGWRELWADPAFRYAMLYTADDRPAPRRRCGVAVEPTTCPPNALNTGEGLITLAPGEGWSAAWGIRAGGE
jgi:aldose 1-epimerase